MRAAASPTVNSLTTASLRLLIECSGVSEAAAEDLQQGPYACKKVLCFLQLRVSGELSSLSGRHLTAVRNWQAPL